MAEEVIQKVRLDLGCGSKKAEGFIGVDIRKFDGVDIVADLREKWPWEDNSVDEVNSSHTVEHLTWPERVHFFNELYRVLKKGAKALIVTPHWSHACHYGDPTHQAPMSEWYCYYLNADWRKDNAPHTDYVCDFDFTFGGTSEQWLQGRNQEFSAFAMNRYVNSWRDLVVTLIKK